MSTRRSRPPRARKSRSSEAPSQLLAVGDMAISATHPVPRDIDPTETAQLRALEAGWDELLS
jgi:hypothetical protein